MNEISFNPLGGKEAVQGVLTMVRQYGRRDGDFLWRAVSGVTEELKAAFQTVFEGRAHLCSETPPTFEEPPEVPSILVSQYSPNLRIEERKVAVNGASDEAPRNAIWVIQVICLSEGSEAWAFDQLDENEAGLNITKNFDFPPKEEEIKEEMTGAWELIHVEEGTVRVSTRWILENRNISEVDIKARLQILYSSFLFTAGAPNTEWKPEMNDQASDLTVHYPLRTFVYRRK